MDAPNPAPPATAPAKTIETTSSGLAAAGVLLLVGLIVVAGWYAPAGVNLGLITLLMFLVMLVLGLAITKRPFGVLLNERNLVSLSRFQMALWTVIVLAAYFTFALARIKASTNDPALKDPLNIIMDWHLWALMGISTTSLVGAPLILSTKKDKDPDPSVVPKTARAVAESPADINANRQGTLYANPKMTDARFTDMFQGDELVNTAHIDLAKVQMFYFTIIAGVAFFVLVFNAIVVSNPDLSRLPVLPDGLVAILGISNAGYLTSKGIDHTKTVP
jgi:hypothetical protein